jgi:hypothetical protein
VQQRMSLIVILLFTSALTAVAMPIDWHGKFGVDTTLIDNFRRMDATGQVTNIEDVGANGTQELQLGAGNHANASFQTYIFQLNPVILINDAATIKAELTNGTARGGRLGDSVYQTRETNVAHSLYYLNTTNPAGSSLYWNQLYVELFSDNGTYLIGRHSDHWGLGAVVNNGYGRWDRHVFTRDGISLKLKINNFFITPFWGKVSSNGSLTAATDAKEYGFSLLYDNPDRDFAFGLYYAKKVSGPQNGDYSSDVDGDGAPIQLLQNDTKLTDIYFRKSFQDITFSIEVPLFSGDLGAVYTAGSSAKYKAKAVITDTRYVYSDRWKFGVGLGSVQGDDGGESGFGAAYLNPNFQIANLLFRYNLRAVSAPDAAGTPHLFDAYISNTQYLKLYTEYTKERWIWKGAVIYARAEQVATAGAKAYNHTNNRQFDATVSQDQEMGVEIDTSFDYLWNSEITIGGEFGYLFTGDYFAYTNDATKPNSAANSYMMQMNLAVEF